MRAPCGVVAGWGAGLLALALLLIAYWPFDLTTGPLPLLLLAGSGLLMALVAAVVLVAIRQNRLGVQRRQPRRAAVAVCAAVALAVGLLGFALDWWMTLFALYAVGMAGVLARGDRAPRGAFPAGTTTAARPAGPPQLVHRGVGSEASTPVARVVEEKLGPPAPRVRRISGAAVAALVWRALRRRRGRRP